jgi:hypothetical protein
VTLVGAADRPCVSFEHQASFNLFSFASCVSRPDKLEQIVDALTGIVRVGRRFRCHHSKSSTVGSSSEIIVGFDNILKLQPANEFATTVARIADILH